MANLTPKQQKIYDFIRDFSREYGYPPTVREIGEHLGLKSPSTVKFHLDNLRAAGLIQWDGGKTRSITLLEKEDEPKEDMVPVLGNVAAGSPILAQEYIEDYLPFDTNGLSGEHFALKVRGESMLNAGILPGDLVVVHQQRDARNGEIVVALFEDEATVKTLSRRDGHTWLLPENEAYAPIDGDNAEIIGKVVGVVRRY